MLKPEPVGPIPEEAARVAKAAFPKGSTATRLRDQLGTLYEDADFAALFPKRGQPALAPWRLALVTVLQFLEGLPDRQAAEAVRGRIDWKYALGLELADPGFDFSVLSEFRARLAAGGAETLLLERMLERFKERGLVKARGRQRTDSTHVLSAVRACNRAELVGETLRAALNELAVAAPEWTRTFAHPRWFERYGRRVEDYRLPKGKAAREAYVLEVGEDGFALLDALDAKEVPPGLRDLPAVGVLRLAWSHHYERADGRCRWRAAGTLPPAGERFDSPYDAEAHYGNKRTTTWSGYKLHVTESCDEGSPRIVTHVETTGASVTDVTRTQAIHEALEAKGLPPGEHVVDAGYVDADLLARSGDEHGIDLIGPTRANVSWQARTEGAYDASRFEVDWENRRVTCPQGKTTSSWHERPNAFGTRVIHVCFRRADCCGCEARSLCTRVKDGGSARHLNIQPRARQEALEAARRRQGTDEWRAVYDSRAGIEATFSQGVRAFRMRRSRYRGLARTAVGHAATAAAINVSRAVAWLEGRPLGGTRVSRFAALRA